MVDDLILKVAKRLKQFTLDDIVMFCEIEAKVVVEFLEKSENIKQNGKFYEYISCPKQTDKFKIVDKTVDVKNTKISVNYACEIFLEICKNRNLTQRTLKEYKSSVNAHIIPFFRDTEISKISITDVNDFKINMQNSGISARRIKNILIILNQIIKHFQNEGYIERTCVFLVKRLEKIPKREIQILSAQQLAQLFKITKKKYPYLLPIIQKVIRLKQPLNTFLTGSEQEKNRLKRKIRKDFCKIKKEMNLENYMFDDLRFYNRIDN